MALTAASFLISYPEFANIPETMINARIADAAHKVNAEYWGDELDHGQALWTAHLLITSPAGQSARLSSDKAESIYRAAYDEAAWRNGCGARVF